MREPTNRHAILFIGLAFLSVGCVERRMTVRSNPSNALVILDGQEVGFTPVSVPFHYYGVRQIKLVKDGYETKVINQHINAPWYQWLGVDFVSEVLIPFRIRDERDYGLNQIEYTLQPKLMVPNEQLLQRAQDVRVAAHNPPARVADAVRKSQPAPQSNAAPPDSIPVGALEAPPP